jgi:hypothetical protein
MEFGTKFSAGKEPRETSAIITDTNGSLRLEMGRPSHACSAFEVSHSGHRATTDQLLYIRMFM